jgi:hypothetical protein
MLASLLFAAALHLLTLAPWHGPYLPTAASSGASYLLTIHGAPNARIHLEGRASAKGWIVSFCTPTLCSPFRYDATLSPRGTTQLELQAVRTNPRTARTAFVTVRSRRARVSFLAR